MSKPDKKNKKSAAKPKKKSGKFTWILVLVSLVMIMVFKLGFLFFVIGILPSIVSFYIDATRSNLSFQTIFTCNLAGVLPFMAEMLKDGGGSGAIQAVIADTTNWLIVYSAAALGWLLVFVAPIISRAIITTLHDRQIARLERQQELLIGEWGEELAAYMKVNSAAAE